MKIDREKALDYFRSKAKSQSCSLCGADDWHVYDEAMQLTEFQNWEQKIVPGAQVMPVIVIACQSCGYLYLIAAILAGVVRPSPAGTESSGNA